MSTPGRAKPFPGHRLYQQRAEKALPLLVRQAMLQKEITYTDLARLMNMPNARNLNYVLGSIGNTLTELSRKWPKNIPPIQAITVNAKTRLPGKGGQWFVGGNKLQTKTTREKRRVIEQAFDEIFAYQYWPLVLKELGLKMATEVPASRIKGASNSGKGGGESDNHKKMKLYISQNPGRIGLKGVWSATIEYPLASGDRVDVVFEKGSQLVAVELKSQISSDADVCRGLFQCLKYQVVLEAQCGLKSETKRVRSLLALEGKLDAENLNVKTALGVDVFESVLLLA